MAHGDQRARLFVEVQDGIHHQILLLHGNAGIVFVERILLQKTETDHAGDFEYQFLVIRKHIASDQLYDFQQAALLIEKSHQPVAVIHELRRYIILIPGT